MSTAPQIREKTAAEVRNLSIDFRGSLDSGESLTGAVTLSVDPAGLTVDQGQVTAAAKVINGQSVPAGQAVQCRASGGTAGETYTITASVATDGAVPQTLNGLCRLRVT